MISKPWMAYFLFYSGLVCMVVGFALFAAVLKYGKVYKAIRSRNGAKRGETDHFRIADSKNIIFVKGKYAGRLLSEDPASPTKSSFADDFDEILQLNSARNNYQDAIFKNIDDMNYLKGINKLTDRQKKYINKNLKKSISKRDEFDILIAYKNKAIIDKRYGTNNIRKAGSLKEPISNKNVPKRPKSALERSVSEENIDGLWKTLNKNIAELETLENLNIEMNKQYAKDFVLYELGNKYTEAEKISAGKHLKETRAILRKLEDIIYIKKTDIIVGRISVGSSESLGT